MFKWFRRSTLDPLSVSMAGVKLGDRVLVIGCSDPRLIAALAIKSGLTGRTCACDESDPRVREAERVALREGALIEATRAAPDALPFDPESFDLVVLRDTEGVREPQADATLIASAVRVLRPGGRCMVVNTLPRTVLGGLFGARTASAGADQATTQLKAQGFVAVRTLAEREGLLFVEAIKPNR